MLWLLTISPLLGGLTSQALGNGCLYQSQIYVSVVCVRGFKSLEQKLGLLFRVKSSSQTKLPLEYSNCKSLGKTEMSGFVVILLYRTSGRFMGMGGIIDKKTVITAEQVLKVTRGVASRILVLAGYRSPWWGKDSQVRRASEMVVNNYELALVKLKTPWTFNGYVYPIDWSEPATPAEAHYVDNLLVYGIHTNTDFSSGDPIPKRLMYTAVRHSITKDCGKQYPDLKEPFNSSMEQCLSPNASFCAGCVGSPVIATGKRGLKKRLTGVVVRSGCLFEVRDVLVARASAFSHWIRYNSFLA